MEFVLHTPEQEEWAKTSRTVVHVTVAKGDDEGTGRVGLITQTLAEIAPKPESAIAVCGPPIMVKFVLKELEKPQDAASKRSQDA